MSSRLCLALGPLILVQRDGELADSNSYAANFVEAGRLYHKAAEGARRGIELARQSSRAVEEKLFLKLLQRYEEKEIQLKRMIDSPEESVSRSLVEDHMPRVEDLSEMSYRAPTMSWDEKYESLLRDDDEDTAADPHTWDTLFWGGVNRLMHIFSPFTAHQKSPMTPAPPEDLEKSFVFVNNSPVKIAQSAFDPSELAKLREEIALLKNENDQLKKSLQSKNGVNEVVAENSQLKQSIMLFQSEVQKHTNLIRERQSKSMMQSQAGRQRNERSTLGKPTLVSASTLSSITELKAPLSPSPISSVLSELKADLKSSKSLPLLEELEQRFVEHENQIQELRRYKEKWRNLKRDARKNASSLSSSPTQGGLELSSSLFTSSNPSSDKKA